MKLLLSIVAVTVLFTGTAIAQQRMGPPQEAFDACSGSSNGDRCSFEGKRGEILPGTCGTPRGANESGQVCMPSNNRGAPGQMSGQRGMNDRRGPPPEAISACEGSSEGSSCSFSGPRGDTLSGTCNSKNDQLACAPSGMPPMR